MNIVVGITGVAGVPSASCGPSCPGHDVHVVATEAALRFVGRPTLEAISRNPVHSDLYEGVAEVRHVALGQRADLIVIAPATANTIAKLAAGLADDLLGNTVLASSAPLRAGTGHAHRDVAASGHGRERGDPDGAARTSWGRRAGS